jgi:Putative addiction module component.
VQSQPIIKDMTSMNNTESIEKELLRLNPEARAKLVHSLVKSLGNLSETELKSLWLDEAERRDAEFESGAVEAVSGDEVLNRIRNRHGF